MSSRTVGWSRTTLFVSGSFLPAATSDSSRSTRKMMSVAAPSLARDYTRGFSLSRSRNAAATGSGSMALTSPPKRATSLASDELT
jgi:hypothetical protein